MDKLITNLDTNLGPVLREQLDTNFQKIQNGVDGQADSLNKQIETMLGDVPLQDKNEVTQARIDDNNVVYSTLKGRLDADQSTAETALKEERLTGAEVQSARSNTSGRTYPSLADRINDEEASLINGMNAKISQISSEPETFANLSALQSAYPNGKTGLFVTADNGHKFIWANSTWTDAGVYQSVGIASGSVYQSMLAPDAQFANLVAGEDVFIDFGAMKIIINSALHVRIGTVAHPLNSTHYELTMDTSVTGFYIYYDTVNNSIDISNTGTIPSDGVMIGWVNLGGGKIQYYISASSVVANIENKYIKPVDRKPYISTGNVIPNIDTTSRTITLNVPYMNAFYSNASISMTKRGVINLDIGKTVSFIYYDPSISDFVVYESVPHLKPQLIEIGVIEWNNPLNATFNFPVTIDNVALDYTVPSGKRVKIASAYPFVIDVENKTLNLPSDLFVVMDYEGGFTSISENNSSSISIATENAGASFIYIDVKTLKISAYKDKFSAPFGSYYLGWINFNPAVADLEMRFVFKNEINIDLPYSGKNATYFGDSITWSYNQIKWAQLVNDKLGSIYHSDAIAGTTYVVSQSNQTSAVERSRKITGQSLITVWFGINDFHFSNPLGVFGSTDNTTFFGAVEETLSTLITNNPNADIYVLTPMKQHGYVVNGTTSMPDSDTPNGIGLKQIDYVNAIKQVAEHHSIPILDMFSNSGIDAFNKTQATTYLRDGLHPNQAGEYRVSSKVLNFIESN